MKTLILTLALTVFANSVFADIESDGFVQHLKTQYVPDHLAIVNFAEKQKVICSVSEASTEADRVKFANDVCQHFLRPSRMVGYRCDTRYANSEEEAQIFTVNTSFRKVILTVRPTRGQLVGYFSQVICLHGPPVQ